MLRKDKKNIADFHNVTINLNVAKPSSKVKCPLCKINMERKHYNVFVCNPDTRNPICVKEKYSHYHHCKPEPIKLIEKYQLNFSEGCFIKYMLRCEFKGDKLGDLKKAQYYLKRCKENCFPRSIDHYEIMDYYESKKFSKDHLHCIIKFINGYRLDDLGYINEFLENEIYELENNNLSNKN